MRRYAEKTQVAPNATLEQIRRAILSAGATRWGTDEGEGFAQIGFQLHGRTIRFRVEYPAPDDREFTHTAARGYERSPQEAQKLWEQAIRQRWRALYLIIKAKLEAIASGILTAEDEFLPYTVLKGGRTVGEWVASEQHFQALMNPMPLDVEALPLPPGGDR